MPSQYRIKIYIPGAYYHIFNRGVAKQNIFLSKEDFTYFLNKMDLFSGTNTDVVAYCLMQNHFHILIQNRVERGMERFMRSLGTSYSQYFNRKYGRVGHLFQESYKARMIKGDKDMTSVISYIHQNPHEDHPNKKHVYPYSSEKNILFGKDCPAKP